MIFCLPSIANAAIIPYLNNLDPGGPSESGGSIGVVGVAKVAIGFDIVTPQDGAWKFTIRIFNPDPALVSLHLVIDNTDVGAINGHQPGTTPPVGFSLGPPSSTPGSGSDRSTVAVSGSGTLSAGKYWLVGSTTSPTPDEWDWLNGSTSYDVNGPEANDANFYGVRLSTGGITWNSAPANTLSLGIDVTAVPEASPFLLNPPILAGSQVQLSFNTVTGKTYTLQLNTNLSITNWSNVQTNAGDGSTKTNLITPTGPERYYRLLRN